MKKNALLVASLALFVATPVLACKGEKADQGQKAEKAEKKTDKKTDKAEKKG